LRIARRTGIYRDRTIDKFPIPRAQYGFLAVALMRALENTEYPDRVAWIEDFKRIRNGVDAALFMTEALPKPKRKRGRRRPDPLAKVTEQLRTWFTAEPWRTGRELLERLQAEYPGSYPTGLLRTLQRRLKIWRSEIAHTMVFGAIHSQHAESQAPAGS
jgi:hypothetical protein